MERERPEYLPPIERRRWYFPWLVTGFLTVISLATIGVLTLGRTNSAWSERFEGLRRTADAVETAAPTQAMQQREVVAAPVVTPSRARPEQLGRDMRCINGMLFRRIEGGWENLPGSRCGDQPTMNVQCFAGKPYRQMAADGGWVLSPNDRCP
ncbi:TPA: hypothetical protein ACXIGC_000038 [Stenotrophomonas maltophilia]|jgi:hypothetical protein|nr:hypothetical protein [Stenotrophomonas maltophilia]MBH1596244.1 hypothetical protein [Stenotrophomonas maltophilia]MBH1740253.1 hypothetical protein [Stenotrophomonas maltophilia]MBN5095099.1 hypothetical protein [Stenotrophomonas maltophilia]HDS1367298.1 hypothetical protein [Stenotrophomonas maltophilia]HDS1371420.1 hypothetical protein [Stenotrophomonas maltophilia]